ncbi:MAG TPA: diacylglycerol kinase family protein [Polyangia bacterium]
MDSGQPLVIVNPRSGGGLSEARWARIRGALADGLGELESAFTTAPRDATEIARREAAAGRRLILALGGDGTISEVADGVLAAGAGGTTEIGLIPRGTGGDFRRTLEVPQEIAAAAAHIRQATARAVDAGRVRYRVADGGEGVRHFVNVASFGFSSAVARRANASSKRFGGKMAFLGATLKELLTHDHHDVWLTIDGRERRQLRVMMAAIGNGRFFGGGMKICPDAQLDDGALDLVSVGDMTRMQVVANLGKLFAGTHLELEQVTHARITHLHAEPVEPDVSIPVELDGETPGHLPATFDILPGALRVRA